ncbi:hypothetical protein GCM10020295_70980 [Streptomyces cinereospinus]
MAAGLPPRSGGDTGGDLEISAEPAGDFLDGLDDQLRREPGDRLADLMGRQPVVQQCDLGSRTPAGQHGDDAGEGGRRAYGDTAPGHEPGGFEALLLIDDQPAQFQEAHGSA